jgi:hypothetical protein
MKRSTQTILSVGALSWMIAAFFGFSASSARADSPPSQDPTVTILYLLRHGEDMPELQGDASLQATVTLTNCNADGTCCVEALNPQGKVRAAALADWFTANRITPTLTHVIASHKLRTRQTVQPLAQAAGLGGDLNGDGIPDGTDIDQAPGDGVLNVPSTPAECDPGWTSSSSVIGPQTNYINTIPLGSRAVLCSHSPALYPIMQAFGIDTSDPVQFPKDSRGRVSGFNNLWIVELQPVVAGGTVQYRGRLLQHNLLDFGLSVSVINRNYGVEPSHAAMDDEE